MDIDAFMSVSNSMMRCSISSSECVVLHFTCTNVPSVSPLTEIYSFLGAAHATNSIMVKAIVLRRTLCSFKIDIFYVYIRPTKIVKKSKFEPSLPLKMKLMGNMGEIVENRPSVFCLCVIVLWLSKKLLNIFFWLICSRWGGAAGCWCEWGGVWFLVRKNWHIVEKF